MLTQHSLPPLSHVEVRTSGIIPAPISDVRPAAYLLSVLPLKSSVIHDLVEFSGVIWVLV